LFLFHARRVRTRTDRPHPDRPSAPPHPSRTAPGHRRSASKTLPHKNERAQTRVRAQKQAAVCKRQRKLRGGGRSGRPRVFPFLQLPKWRRKRQTQPEMSAVLSNPKHFYISQPERSLFGGVGGHRQTHLRACRGYFAAKGGAAEVNRIIRLH
jgi:hypothetical protein